MPRLFVLSGDDVGRTYDFDRTVELGRSKEVGVPLRSTSVSRRHARIEQRDGRWYLVDLDSRNGVFLNGVGVERVELEDGAVFVLGTLELRFRLASPGGSAPPPPPEPDRSAAPDDPVVELDLGLDDDDSDGDGDEIDLEGDWSTESPPPPPAPPGSRVGRTDPELGATTTVSGAITGAAARTSAARTAARVAALGERPAAAERTTHSGGRILQYNKLPERAGIMHADLGQQSLLVRSLLYLLGIGVFLAICYGAYRLTTTLREQAQPVAPLEER